MMKPTMLLCALILSLSRADTVQVAGHRYPEEMEHQSLNWTLSGAEHFRYRLFSVFTGALYSSPEAEEARVLRFTYTRRIPAATLVEQGMRVLRSAHPEAELEARAKLLQEVNNAYRDVREGDRYTFTVLPGRGTWLHFNEEQLFFVADSDFGLWYLDIWLGDKPMSVPLRDALLKGLSI